MKKTPPTSVYLDLKHGAGLPLAVLWANRDPHLEEAHPAECLAREAFAFHDDPDHLCHFLLELL